MSRPRRHFPWGLLVAAGTLTVASHGYAGHSTSTVEFDGSLELIGQPRVVAQGHNGSGTAIVQIENNGLNLRYAEDGKRLFGDCQKPAGARDYLGWEPEGENCRIAWVMCILWWENEPPNNYRLCDFSEEAESGGHATTTAKILVQTAPGAKIVAISICDGSDWCGALNAKGALRWLYNNRLGEASVKIDRGTCIEDERECERRKTEWRKYWAQQFGDQTPAERFNIVVANLSFVALWTIEPGQTGMAHFSDHCLPRNPNPAGPNPTRYIDDWLVEYGWDGEAEWFDFRQEMAGLRDSNIVPVTAAGNGLPVNSVTANSVLAPACAEGAVVVSAIPEDYQDEPAPHGSIRSSVSPTLTTLVSPAGVATDLPLIPGWPASPHIPFFPRAMSATSWAAPIVAGSVAILRAPDLAPDNSVEETITLLQRTGQPAIENRDCNPDADPDRAPPSLWCPPAELYGNPHQYILPRIDLEAAAEAVWPD